MNVFKKQNSSLLVEVGRRQGAGYSFSMKPGEGDDRLAQLPSFDEFADNAILMVFGQHGEGLFAGPSAIEAEICRQYRVQAVGRIDQVKERFYAISAERRLKHPAVIRICSAARETLFGDK